MADNNARWDEAKDYPKADIKKAHDTLVNGAGMLGVAYRRVLRKNRELRQQLEEKSNA